MARTKITKSQLGIGSVDHDQISNGSIYREDLNINTTGQAIIRKVIAGTNISISYDGIDPGTGDVTINASSSLIPPMFGGTGVANGVYNTITFTGNYSLGITLSNDTVVTFPLSGTLATTSGSVANASNLNGGNATTLLGSIPYQSAVNATTLLAPNTTTTKKFLRQTGDGTNGAVPAWDTIIASDLPIVTPTVGGTGVANGVNNTITFTGNYTLGIILSADTSLTLPSSGTLVNTNGTVAKANTLTGGNGTTSLGAVLYQSNTDVTTLLSPNITTTKKFLRQTGDGTNGAVPAWDTIVVGDLPLITSAYGGTGNGFTKFTGPTTSEKTFTLPDANATILYSGSALGTPASGTVTNLTGTASININGTVGATTPTTGAFTTGTFTKVTIGTLSYAAANAVITTQASVAGFEQIVIQNSSPTATASADIVVNNDNSTDTTYYGDFGINSSSFTGSGSLTLANATYLTATTGDLSLGTTTANAIHFVVNSGATDALTISATGNVSLTGQVISTKAYAAADGAGNLYLNSVTGNRIDFNANGVAAPAFTTRSTGTKIVLYPAISANAVDCAIGVDSNALWFSVPTTAAAGFKWYGGTSNVASLDGAGNFSAVSKSFVIDHPSKKGMKLQYGSLESPYHGVQLSGRSRTINKKVAVKLPRYLKDLVKEEGINIQLTNIRHGHTLWVEEIDLPNNKFIVESNKSKECEFFWIFTAIRKDIHDLEVEYGC